MRLLSLGCLLLALIAVQPRPAQAQDKPDIALVFGELLLMVFTAGDHCDVDVDRERIGEVREKFLAQYGPDEAKIKAALTKDGGEDARKWEERLAKGGPAAYCAEWLALYGPAGTRWPGILKSARPLPPK